MGELGARDEASLEPGAVAVRVPRLPSRDAQDISPARTVQACGDPRGLDDPIHGGRSSAF